MILTIDVDVQKLAEESLAQGLAAAQKNNDRSAGGPGRASPAPGGAAVVLDPTGRIGAGPGHQPDLQPADFVGGISQAKFNQYLNDSKHPLDDRTIQGPYAPGSTFKLVTAMAGLQAGIITPGQYFNDLGFIKVGPNRSTTTTGTVYGEINLSRRHHRVERRLLLHHRAASSGRAGRTTPTTACRAWPASWASGPPVACRSPTRQPAASPTRTSRAREHALYPKAFTEGGWFTGDNVITAIGQGEVAVTPLQLANAYATFANGGTLWHHRSHLGSPTSPGSWSSS